jgi:HEAT repeat protein
MESKESQSQQPEAGVPSGGGPDKAAIEGAKEIFHVLAHTVSSLKLFPSHHSTVQKFVDELLAKLKSYFENRLELEAAIGESAFYLDGEKIYKEENLIKSLPYLFYKDGMQRFAILRDIDRAELRDFLEVIKKDSLLPPDESDIVISIWEKDFSNIRITAPDDYLLSKIAIFEKQQFGIAVDKKQLYTGRIELAAEDKQGIVTKRVGLGLLEDEEKKDYAELVMMLDDKDLHSIEAMVGSARQISPDKEFLDMIFELLYMEDQIEKFVPILGFLDRHHKELLQEGKFTHAGQFLRQIQELKNIFAPQHPAKAAELERFLESLKGGRTVALVREAVEHGDIDSILAFFDYLRLLGPRSIPLAAELLESTENPEFRTMAFDYLTEAGRGNTEILANQLQDGKPVLSKGIISFLSQTGDKKVLPYFATIHTYQNKDIKLEAIEGLSRFKDKMANKIILGFFSDPEEDIRIAAAEKLQWLHDKSTLEHVVRLATDKRFYKKSPQEQSAVFNFLARTKTPEALDALRRALKISSLFSKAKYEETQLCAVQALENMATPEALEALDKGKNSSNKKVAEACRKALANIPGEKVF